MTNLNELTATEAASKILNSDITAEELTQSCLDHIEQREPEVQAWTYLDPDHALVQARAADAKRQKGEPVGLLNGLPVGIKDIIDTADMPTENGSPIFQGRRPEKDASCVAVLRGAGAVIMGKTVTTELANRHPGKTHNPHNLEHTPGGSSSGSAAAVADFQLPLALGTQTAGSVIRPASFCGIYGLKPTLGFISRSGVLLQSHSLDTVGVYGRSVEDLGLLADGLSAYDPTDSVSYPSSRSSLRAALREEPPTTPRLAFVKTPAWDDDVVEDSARRAVSDFVAGLGKQCQEEVLPSPFDHILDHHSNVMMAEDFYYYGEYLDNSPELLSDVLSERLRAARAISTTDYIQALNARDEIYAGVEKLLARYDAIICLAAPGPAPKGLQATGSAICNGLWTYLGMPCVTLPLLKVNGLPMGVQLVGLRRDEGRLLRTARWLDRQ